MMTPDLQIRRLGGAALLDYIPALARLRIDVFREFPYLYDGSLAYEHAYLRAYAESPRAVIVLALAGGEVVGASTGMPLAEETEAFQRPFRERGLDPSRYFYCAESVLRPEWRGRGLGHRFFDEREAHARELGGFDYSCFCAVNRPDTHPRRPADYRPLNDFWTARGYRRHPELVMSLGWKDLDDAQGESIKSLTYWIRPLSP